MFAKKIRKKKKACQRKRVKRMKRKRRAQKQNKPPRGAQSFHLKTLGKACVRKVRAWAGSGVLGG